MISKDLQRFVQEHESSANDSAAMQDLQRRLRDKPFWMWFNKRSGADKDHLQRFKSSQGNCCFNHIIGLPKKNGKEMQLFEYQRQVNNALFIPSYINKRPMTAEEERKYERLMIEAELKTSSKKESVNYSHAEALAQKTQELIYPFKVKHVWIKKAAGLGITELVLRIMVWLCLKDDKLSGSHMCIVTGPRIELAIELINRIRKLFEPHNISLGGKETSIKIGGVTITCYPSNHLDSMRGLDNVSFIFLDEADFFPKHEQENARIISERYIAKNSPYILMCSTANRPDGLFASIEKEPYETCLYKKLFLHYTEGLGKIYTEEEIENAQKSLASFEREYCLLYLGRSGNIFAPAAIENCQKVEYNPDQIIPECKVSIGIDPSFGSKFGIVATRYANGRIEVIEAEEYERPDFQDMIDRVWEIKQKHKVDNNNLTIYVDAANPEIWQSLKRNLFNEPYAEKYVCGIKDNSARPKYRTCNNFNSK